MELPSKILVQILFYTKLKMEEQMLTVMNNSTHGEILSQPNFFSTRPISVDEINGINIPKGAHELVSLNDEIRRITIRKIYSTEEKYPFVIKPNFFHFRQYYRN